MSKLPVCPKCNHLQSANLNLDFEKMRADATEKYRSLQEQAQPVLDVISDPEAVAKLKGNNDKEKNLDWLRSEHNVGEGLGQADH
jgi:hypothetical protein